MAASEGVGPDGVSKEFDPRFSRAFQPGYDPRVHREAPPTALQRDEPGSYSAQGIRESDSILGSQGLDESDAGANEKAGFGAPGRSATPGARRDAGPETGLATGSGTDLNTALNTARNGSRDDGRDAGSRAGINAASDDELVPEVWWRRLNPWFLVLWALGFAFIGAGVAVIFAINDVTRINGTSGFDNYVVTVLFQMGWVGVPMLFVLGLATLTSTVVIQAARWHRP